MNSFATVVSIVVGMTSSVLMVRAMRRDHRADVEAAGREAIGELWPQLARLPWRVRSMLVETYDDRILMIERSHLADLPGDPRRRLAAEVVANAYLASARALVHDDLSNTEWDRIVQEQILLQLAKKFGDDDGLLGQPVPVRPRG